MHYLIVKLSIIFFLFVYALFLLSLYNSKDLFRGKAALMFFGGAITFIFVLAVQNPIQSFISNSGFFSKEHFVVGIVVLALIAGFFQEFLKLLPVFFDRWNVYSAAASGAGFGFVQAMLMLTVLTQKYTIPSMAEWLAVVVLQIALTAMLAFGLYEGKGILSYIVISITHALCEGVIIYAAMRPTFIVQADIILAVIAVPLMFVSVKAYRIQQEGPYN